MMKLLVSFLFLAVSWVASQQDCCDPTTNLEICCRENAPRGPRGPGGHGGPGPGGHGRDCCQERESCCAALDIRRCCDDRPQPPLPDRCCDDSTPPTVPNPPVNFSVPLICVLGTSQVVNFSVCCEACRGL
ncbi:hypothetical protein KC19_1G084400 [Ceratodon purpureus]|uniref:Uncharacterized protein n=1 Tax=Ceratodon purpureus TaxID=3225 RepID=A0A8T0J2W1_CERPU|nr:hypothetical protein KC19_1G084400 [Ceratodon purpureus]